MALANVFSGNFLSGELSPKLRGRFDLPIFNKGAERIQNFICEVQGSLRYRSGFMYVNHTRLNQAAVLIPFQFNDQQSYLIEATNQAFRFYKNNAVITEAPITISGATQANPGVITATAHGYSNGNEIFINGVSGMTALNGKSYLIASATTNTFTLTDVYGNAINTSSFSAYTSGGTASRVYEVGTPYATADLETIQYTQNADTMYMVHQNYAPMKLTRSGNTNWTLSAFSRTADPFTSAGNYPGCVRFYEGRLFYAGTLNNPQKFWGSRAPDTSGNPRYDDFTVPSSPTDADAVIFTTAQTNGEVDNIQWIAGTSKLMMFGNFGSISKVTGSVDGDPITPSSINVKPLTSVGCARALPYSDGNAIFFIRRSTLGLESVAYNFVEDSYIPYDRSESAEHLALAGLKRIMFQSGKPDIIWALRQDGVFLGLTYKDGDTEPGWHQHYMGGSGNVLSIGQMPRPASVDQLWAIIQRTINGQTLTSVEYMTDEVLFPDPEAFYTNESTEVADTTAYLNATYELQKSYVFLDTAQQYDGAAYGINASATLTPGTGANAAGTVNVTFTASAGVFDATMVGRQLWKSYSALGAGGGRALITGFISTTQVTCTINVAFDLLTAIAAGMWRITATVISGLTMLEGQTVGVVTDGAVDLNQTVVNGSITIPSAASVVTVGLGYQGFLKSMNLEIGGINGPAQTKTRNVAKVSFRFLDTLGIMFGTAMYKLDTIQFRESNAYMGRPVPVFSGVLTQSFEDEWANEKHIYVIQNKPLPVNIQGVDVYASTSND
jgi:hypothetical protein